MTKRRVLILCTGNSARSQLAEGLLRSMASDRFEVFSAGTKPTGLNPNAVAAMEEAGIDISGHRSKAVDEFAGQRFDYVITVCDNAKEACPVFPGPARRLHQSFPDPAAEPLERQAEAFRAVRDQIAAWLRGFVESETGEAGFRDVRRTERALTEDAAREILARAEHGVLATSGADGWPYAIPVNHVLRGDALYLHCAGEGHKLENIAHEERVCYCAVASARVAPEKLTTYYESAVAFGRAALVTDPAEKWSALKALVARFCVDVTAEAEKAISTSMARTAVVRIRLERITGKANRPV